MDRVVKLYKQDLIGVVALEEREARNTFTHRFINELKETFEIIQNDSEINVVVIHGYDNYFCCGGTKDELINLSKGVGKEDADERVQFDDLNFHDLLLRCEVPVIAAMQGHALGGGLSFGCFADIIIMAEQCIYNAIFMKYGFTPGMGSTYIIPKKLGDNLGAEMLYSARNFYGSELKERGASVTIVPKGNVIDTAMSKANELVDKPRLSLKALKHHLSARVKAELPYFIEKELEMHRQTFGQPEVLERIEKLFGA